LALVDNIRVDGWAMTTRDAHSAEQAGTKRLRFDRYVLDLPRGCLLFDGNEVVLRPKTFAVLRHLVENSGRLVSKDELFAAVWPNLAITDDALVQSISELRQALGDDGRRLICTVPRRGYRFESAVSVVAPPDLAVTDGTTVSAASRDGAQSPAPAIWARASNCWQRCLPAGTGDCSPLSLSRLCSLQECYGPLCGPAIN
jgi:DNA-binding winged helix-turn-helix (wHTH) protein